MFVDGGAKSEPNVWYISIGAYDIQSYVSIITSLNPAKFPLGHHFTMDANFFDSPSDARYQELLGDDEKLVELVLDALGYI